MKFNLARYATIADLRRVTNGVNERYRLGRGLGDNGCYRELTMDEEARRTSLHAHSTRALEDSVSKPGSVQSNQLAQKVSPSPPKTATAGGKTRANPLGLGVISSRATRIAYAELTLRTVVLQGRSEPIAHAHHVSRACQTRERKELCRPLEIAARGP